MTLPITVEHMVEKLHDTRQEEMQGEHQQEEKTS
jgi:hypothetical protein